MQSAALCVCVYRQHKWPQKQRFFWLHRKMWTNWQWELNLMEHLIVHMESFCTQLWVQMGKKGFWIEQQRLFVSCFKGIFRQRAVCLVWDYCAASVKQAFHISHLIYVLRSHPLSSWVFVYLATPAYFLPNDTPQWGHRCAVFPINTQAYSRVVARTG